MEDYKLDLVIGQGPSARTVKIDLPRFTLIGATTRAGLLTAPLRDRFGVIARLWRTTRRRPRAHLAAQCEHPRRADRKSTAHGRDRAPFARHPAHREPAAAPRCATTRRSEGEATITLEIARYALEQLEVDEAGFDRMRPRAAAHADREVRGGPVGIDTLAAAIGEDKGTIEDIYEPFLIQEGYLDRTPRGRVATDRAFDALRRKRSRGKRGDGSRACSDLARIERRRVLVVGGAGRRLHQHAGGRRLVPHRARCWFSWSVCRPRWPTRTNRVAVARAEPRGHHGLPAGGTCRASGFAARAAPGGTPRLLDRRLAGVERPDRECSAGPSASSCSSRCP